MIFSPALLTVRQELLREALSHGRFDNARISAVEEKVITLFRRAFDSFNVAPDDLLQRGMASGFMLSSSSPSPSRIMV